MNDLEMIYKDLLNENGLVYDETQFNAIAVSYTHLTLPTKA